MVLKVIHFEDKCSWVYFPRDGISTGLTIVICEMAKCIAETHAGKEAEYGSNNKNLNAPTVTSSHI